MSEAPMPENKTSREMFLLQRKPDRDLFPLSMNQRDMWFQSQIHAQRGLNNVCVRVTLEGNLNVDLFRRAWQAVVNRHEALRTEFVEVEGIPRQKILSNVQVTFSVQDLSGRAPVQQAADVKAVEQEMASRPFDFSAGPLLGFSLLHLGQSSHVFLFVFSHLILDGIYMSQIFEQVRASYEDLLNGGTGTLPELEIQYPDFAAHQNEILAQGLLKQHEAYWQQQLRAPLPEMELPTDRDSRRVTNFDLGVIDRDVPDKVFQQLKTFRKRYRTTLFRIVLGAFEVLLQHLVGEKDLVLGVPFTTLPAHWPELLGFFGHLVPVRADLDGMTRFNDVLTDVNRQLREAQEHLEYPLFEAVRDLKISRDPHRPLFPVVISQVKALETEMGGVRMNMVSRFVQGGVYHLWLTVRELKNGLSLGFYYNRELLAGRPLALIADCMEELLSRIASEPEALLSALEVLPVAEKKRVLSFGSDKASSIEGPWVEELIAQFAHEHPDAPAVTDRNGDVSYKELNAQANRLANWLRSAGIQPEDVVGIMGRRSRGMLTTILGVMKAGAAYVPLDPKDPEERLSGMMKDARLKLLAVDSEAAELGRRLAAGARCGTLSWDDVDVNGVVSRLEWSLSSADEPKYGRLTGNNLAYIFYTSGSTGVPKGAMVERAGMLNHLRAKIDVLALGPGDVVVQNASHCFDISVWQFLAALMVGGRVVIYRDDLVLNPAALLEAVKQDNVTILEIVPSYLELLLGMAEADKLRRLRFLVSTAETLSVMLSRRWLQRFPDIPLINAWGPTECSDDITHEILHPGMEGKERVAIGRPINGAQVYILNRDLQLAPVGCAGEIAVGGVCVGRGYIGDPSKTSLTFVPDPFGPNPSGRLYLTGDVGRWTWDGVLEFLGRRDGQVKVRGRRIEIAEIEGVLSSHPQIRQTAAAAHEGRLVAYWTGDAVLEMRDLRRYVSERLPEHMVPDAFIHLPELPLTRTGKVDRRALPAPNWSERLEEYVGPRTDLESRIAEVWCEVLGIQRIGIHDNFFEIGGHSLNATRIVLKLQALAGPDISIRHLFLNPTIAELAVVMTASASSEPALEKIPRAGDRSFYPLAPTQKPMWLGFNEVLRTGGPGWGFPQLIRIEGEVDTGIFAKALDALIERHESLRLSFIEIEEEPYQVVHEKVTASWRFHDLSSLPDELQRERLRGILTEQLSAPLRNTPPMLNVQLVRLQANRHYMVMQLPHIISDVWTEHILAEDLAELYTAFKEDRSSSLPELHIRYVDYAEWHQKRLESQAMHAQKEYWLSRFSSDFEPLNLSRLNSAEGEPSQKMVLLPMELMDRLRRLAGNHGTTLFVVLLAAFQSLLARLSGSPDIAVGSAVGGRTHPDLERVAGFFMNPLCLRSDLSGDPTFVELLDRVRQTVLSAMAHQDYPFHQWLHSLRRKQGRTNLYPYSIVLLVEEQPQDLGFAGAKAFFESLPGWGFDLRKVAGPTLAVRVSEGPENWCAEVVPGLMDKSRPPSGLLTRWLCLLHEIADNPQERLGAFSLLDKDEQRALSTFNSAAQVDPRLVEIARALHHAGGGEFVMLNGDGRVLNSAGNNSAFFEGSKSSDGVRVLGAGLNGLQLLAAKGDQLRRILPDLERVIVPAQAPFNLGFLSRDSELHLSAFVALDDNADALLWIDDFLPGAPLVGCPSGAPLYVLDEWDNMAPIGVRGRLYTKSPADESGEQMLSLPWSGTWRSDGLLEINARQFDTIEVDAEELEELLR